MSRESWEVSEDAELWEWASSRAEAEYFDHIEGVTHDYPLVRQTAIMLANEPINLGRSPF